MRNAAPMAIVLVAITTAASTPEASACPATGDTPGTLTRWEYRVLTEREVIGLGGDDLAAGLNALGKEGWELTAVGATYIFKRSARRGAVEGLEGRVAVAEAEVAMRRERVGWSERLAAKGYLGETQLVAERARLSAAEAALEQARRELKASSAGPDEAPRRAPDPEE